MANPDHIIRPDCPLSAWALKVEHAEYAFRHGAAFADIKTALDALGMFDLIAAAGGELPAEVTALPQYDRINRGVGEAEGRTILLARDLLAEREAVEAALRAEALELPPLCPHCGEPSATAECRCQYTEYAPGEELPIYGVDEDETHYRSPLRRAA